jgi:hypothetical protein
MSIYSRYYTQYILQTLLGCNIHCTEKEFLKFHSTYSKLAYKLSETELNIEILEVESEVLQKQISKAYSYTQVLQ